MNVARASEHSRLSVAVVGAINKMRIYDPPSLW